MFFNRLLQNSKRLLGDFYSIQISNPKQNILLIKNKYSSLPKNTFKSLFVRSIHSINNEDESDEKYYRQAVIEQQHRFDEAYKKLGWNPLTVDIPKLYEGKFVPIGSQDTSIQKNDAYLNATKVFGIRPIRESAVQSLRLWQSGMVNSGPHSVKYSTNPIGNGVAGFATAKCSTNQAAVELATKKAIQRVFPIPRYHNHTIWHELTEKLSGTSIKMRPRKEGTGLIAHFHFAKLCNLIGIRNISITLIGNPNALNMTKCFFKAVLSQRTIDEVSLLRGVNFVSLNRQVLVH